MQVRWIVQLGSLLFQVTDVGGYRGHVEDSGPTFDPPPR
jgi:hypothetical protein